MSSCEADAGVLVDFRAIVAVCLYMWLLESGWFSSERCVIPKYSSSEIFQSIYIGIIGFDINV